MKGAHVFISGFVQGVGFRHLLRKEMAKLGVLGSVENLPDGRVEALFEGSIEDINKMIALCRKGPFLAEVKDVVVEWIK